jgi:hypothetical protein
MKSRNEGKPEPERANTPDMTRSSRNKAGRASIVSEAGREYATIPIRILVRDETSFGLVGMKQEELQEIVPIWADVQSSTAEKYVTSLFINVNSIVTLSADHFQFKFSPARPLRIHLPIQFFPQN